MIFYRPHSRFPSLIQPLFPFQPSPQVRTLSNLLQLNTNASFTPLKNSILPRLNAIEVVVDTHALRDSLSLTSTLEFSRATVSLGSPSSSMDHMGGDPGAFELRPGTHRHLIVDIMENAAEETLKDLSVSQR